MLSKPKFPKTFRHSVKIKSVNMKMIKKWFSKKLDEIIPDDDILVDYIEELLIQEDEPDIKEIYEQLKSFIGDEEQTMSFCKYLWGLLLEAQDDKDGIPKSLIEQHMKERDENKRIDNRDNDAQKDGEQDKAPKDRTHDTSTRSKPKYVQPHHSRNKGQPHKITKPAQKTDRYIPNKPTNSSSTYNASKRLKSFDKEDNIDLNRF